MIGCNDPAYLHDDQYRNSANLRARIALHEGFSTNPYPWLRWVFDQFALPATARVLEVGCGPATLWQKNAERIPPDWQITLSDFSAGMLADAQRTLADVAHHFTLREANIQELPFADGAYDAVIANHMLYHVPDLDRGLGEVRRVLAPDGTFYAATNGVRHLSEIEWLLQRFDPTLKGGFAMRGGFALENGAALLGSHFATVELRQYEDALVVTDAAPLAAFICSGHIGKQIGARRSALEAFIEHEIVANGPIHITKASGIFLAQ